MRFALLCACLLLHSPAAAQYRNYEVQRDGPHNYSGTIGNKNFDVQVQNGEVQGHVGGQRPGSTTSGGTANDSGATHKRCFVDAHGAAYCQ